MEVGALPVVTEEELEEEEEEEEEELIELPEEVEWEEEEPEEEEEIEYARKGGKGKRRGKRELIFEKKPGVAVGKKRRLSREREDWEKEIEIWEQGE